MFQEYLTDSLAYRHDRFARSLHELVLVRTEFNFSTFQLNFPPTYIHQLLMAIPSPYPLQYGFSSCP